MSTAPKARGTDKKIVYGAIAVALVMLLVCGGVFFVSIAKGLNLFSSSGGGAPVGTQRTQRKETFSEDAVLKPMDAAKAFLSDLRDEEYGHALKYFSTIGFQGRYSPGSLKEMVEREGKGLIGWTVRESLNPVSQSADSKRFRGEVGGGPYGPARFELTVSNEGEGWRVSDFSIAKK